MLGLASSVLMGISSVTGRWSELCIKFVLVVDVYLCEYCVGI